MLGLRDRIKSKVDITGTRAWLQSLDDDDYVDRSNYLSRSELPESLRGLGTGAMFLADEDGNAMIRLVWGSGPMGHWGAVIGMKEMEIPPSDLRWYGEHRVPLEPGVYVWKAIE